MCIRSCRMLCSAHLTSAHCRGPCSQVDVECEYGYERHGEECRPIYGLESAKCTVLDQENYVISETKHRLIDGDSCKGLSQIIGDTDGRGNLPGGHHGRHPAHGWGGATLFLIMLVRGVVRPSPVPCHQASWAALCLHHALSILPSARR